MSAQCFTCDPNPDLLLVNVLVNVVRSIRRHLMLSANYNWFQFASGRDIESIRIEDASIPSAATLVNR